MRKMKLDLDTLEVSSFETGAGEGSGTVQAHWLLSVTCPPPPPPPPPSSQSHTIYGSNYPCHCC